ncbi:MAG: mannose-1-phosphate guanyltransferase [Chloroflexota bacterium]|nr:mannose-1-phosphate guanyltransferase [Chloroflexota bacterium]
MKAVVMAGGEGSRLRPLTINRPKPMVPLADRPVMAHIFELLKLHGITEIIVTVQYLASIIQDFFGDGSALGLNITYSVEETPLGTAGSVKNAEDLLQEPFLVISGDALTDINLSNIINYHNEKQSLVTVALKRVDNPLDYGVVIMQENGCIKQFLEKPSWGEVFSDTVNTGIYIIDPKVFNYFQRGQNVDWSKDIFPLLLQEGENLFGYVTDGYWTDIGTIEAYIRATADYLHGRVQLPRFGTHIGGDIWVGGEYEIAPDARLYGPIFLGHGVKIKGAVTIHGPSVIRDYNIVDTQATIDRSIIWRNSYIGERAELRGAIVTRQSNIKSRALLFEGAVVGDYTIVNAGAVINAGVKIWPSKEIDEGATIMTSIIWGAQGRRVLFGRFGITGLVNIDITPEFCAKLGAAYGGTLPKGSTVLINRDAHYTPRMLKRAIISGLPSAGINVADVSTVPIPVARYMVQATNAAGGIHVRLSPFDNRVVDIKFFDHRGLDIDSSVERTIENVFFREDYRRVYLDEIGRIRYLNGIDKTYIGGFLQALQVEAIQSTANQFSIVVDYANANASDIASTVLRRLGCNVVELNANLNEKRIFQTPTEFNAGMDQLASIVPVLHAEIGVRLDPGGEKMFIVDDRGRRLSDLQTLAALTEMLMRCYNGGTIAVPVSAPRAFEEIARRHGGRIVRTRANLAALMQTAAANRHFLLLGDSIGNLIFPSFYPIADGLFAMVKLMELLALQQIKLSAIVDELPSYHMAQTKVPCRWELKGKVMRMLNEQYANPEFDQIDGVKIDFGEAWVLLQPDPEGPFFRIIAEGSSAEQAHALTEKYAEIVMSLQ